MRYVLSMILLLSLAGFSYAQERLAQLPAGASPVQILGKTYYQSGNTFYAFNEQGRYFYPVQPPTRIRQYEQPRNMYWRGSQPRYYWRGSQPRYYWRGSQPSYYWRDSTPRYYGLTRDQVEGCMNAAADKANANPRIGGKVYIREYNQCISNLRY
ncbi:hypothetical protein Misp06_00735 [Microbulbifer sp. NBRC 101763]|uniref:hypothetical protein n=1 Tax=Microbulbifer TaxID=48073 RepID=UPI00035FCA84|nr:MULTISPECIES: hypothetical protein [Microbulbifer]WHI49460.1 hypothetical protein P3339_13365 [Microbulbifer sp. MLAF003]